MDAGDYQIMIEECRDRLQGLIDAYAKERKALSGYFDCYDIEHSDDDCPQDDTCECPELMPLRDAWLDLGRQIELAYRRVDKIDHALAAIKAATEPERVRSARESARAMGLDLGQLASQERLDAETGKRIAPEPEREGSKP